MPLAVGLGWMGVFVLMLGAIFSGGAIAAFGLIVYWTAWAWVFYGYVCFPSEALADFNSTQWLLMILVTVTAGGGRRDSAGAVRGGGALRRSCRPQRGLGGGRTRNRAGCLRRTPAV